MDVRTAADKAATGAVLMDVRQPNEWAAGRAPQAVHVPLGEVASTDFDDTRTYLVICRSGARSAQAVSFMRASGIDAHNVEGGMHAWMEAGLTMEADGEADPAVVPPL